MQQNNVTQVVVLSTTVVHLIIVTLGAVTYSPSIVTMAVYLTVHEISGERIA